MNNQYGIVAAAAVALAALTACSSRAAPVGIRPTMASRGAPATVSPTAARDCLSGTWGGPIELQVTGAGQGAAAGIYAITAGSGTMQLSIADGRVTSGTWSMAFHATGSARGETGSSVSLDVRATGSASGSTDDVVLAAQWNMTGTARVNVGGSIAQEPIDNTGTDSQHLQLKAVDCVHLSASFLPSFDSNTHDDAAFSGTASWSGTRALLKAPDEGKTP